MLYSLLRCVLTLSQMFPIMFKTREIHNFIQGNHAFHAVAFQWLYIHCTATSCDNFWENTGNTR